jgi:hypothetical protein
MRWIHFSNVPAKDSKPNHIIIETSNQSNREIAINRLLVRKPNH